MRSLDKLEMTFLPELVILQREEYGDTGIGRISRKR